MAEEKKSKKARQEEIAERHLQKVAKMQGIDLNSLSPEEYQKLLTKVTKALRRIPGALKK